MTTSLPGGLPVPEDDGAADHLTGNDVPALALPSTGGGSVRVDEPSAGARRLVLYAYPLTGPADGSVPDGWDLIPGARGCTPEACAFRNHFAELAELGASVAGVSLQSTTYQAEVASRLHLPFPLLSDAELRLTNALGLPTFEVDGTTLLKRLTLVISGGQVEHVFYPVFPPDGHAAEVTRWLAARLKATPGPTDSGTSPDAR